MKTKFPLRKEFAPILVGLACLAGCAHPGDLQGSRGRATFSATARDNAQIELSNRLMEGWAIAKNRPAAVMVLQELSDRGSAPAAMLIGEDYIAGAGVPRNPEMGVSWLQKAADRNLAQAKAELAFVYMRGVGVTADYKRSYDFARSAADQGSGSGMTALGLLYNNGFGVPQDHYAAMKWFQKGAGKRDSSAMSQLGTLYRDGNGVPVDYALSYAWFSLSFAYTANNYDRAYVTKLRDDVALMMSPEDVATGRAMAAAWKPDAAMDRSLITANHSQTGGGGHDDIVVPAAPNPDSTAYRKPTDLAVAERQQTEDIEVAEDGTVTTKFTGELEIKNESAIGQYSQQPFPFNSSIESLDIVEAHTLKRDGRKLPVDVSAIFEQLVPGTPTNPIYSDQKQKIVLFPDVEVGDVLSATVKYVSHPYLPGLFSLFRDYSRTFAHNDVSVRLTVPKSMPLHTETHELKFSKHEAGDKLVYEWHYANPRPLAEDNIVLDASDRVPRLFASSFATYDQMAHAYAAVAAAKTAVTPAIQKTADEVTSGITDRRKQAEALYYWVSRRIRYVAIELGRGSIVPHAADTILTNRYGDCKDHSALLVALLKAKGIEADIVLINYGSSYALPSPPTLAAMNHAITYLPEFDLFVDSTAGVAPFGVLPFGEHGKSVVIATEKGQSVRRTPTIQNGEASITLKTKFHFETDGRIVGDSEAVSTGPFAVWLRQVAANVQNTGLEQAAKQELKSKGLDGKGRFEFSSPFDIATSYRIASHFETVRRQEWMEGTSFYPTDGLALGSRPGEMLLGPIDRTDIRNSEPTPCMPGQEVEDISFDLPKNKHLRELPKGMEFSNKLVHYKSEWMQTGQTVTVHREFSSYALSPVCIGDTRLVAAKALNDIRTDYSKSITLVGN